MRAVRTSFVSAASASEPLQGYFRWWLAPLWFAALFTGAKSFADNPVLGSGRLNRLGLHVWRLRAAYAMARWRRRRLARAVPAELRAQFDRNGFVVIRDLLPEDAFRNLRSALLDTPMECRSQQQGDTVTRRIAVGPKLRREIPELGRLLGDRGWRALLAYVASSRREPLYYIQTICSGLASGPPDPQSQLHSDTFHPSLKAWLFLTDVGPDDCPLTYVAGSHRLSAGRADWERERSIDVLRNGDRLSQRGSLRIETSELAGLGLPQPTRFEVPANTLVVADTSGFHARAASDRPSIRVELWAYSRGNPFAPWAWGGLLSWAPIAQRQAELLYRLLDWLDRRGLRKQHWKPGGLRRALDS